MYIHDFLSKNAIKYPNKVAYEFEDKVYTWAELNSFVNNYALNIRQNVSGASQQQIIGILLPNCIEFVIAYLAILKLGHIAMPFDPSHKKLEITNVAESYKPSLIITNSSYESELPDDIPELLTDKDIEILGSKDFSININLPPKKQIASLLFTSGTTGHPKATAYSHTNHLWNIKAVTKLWQWTSQDTLLLSLPLSHWHGLVMGVAGGLTHANTTYLQARFSAKETLKELTKGRVSIFMHVPIAYFKLNEFVDYTKYPIKNVRLFISGSSFLPPKVWQDFKDNYGYEILERYGASETGLIVSNKLEEKIPGSVGYSLPGVQFRIETDGEIAMKSPGLFLGYYHNQSATKKHTTADGWWLTNDIGELDEKTGRLTLKGRVQEKIKKLGYTVYPRDVEWAVMQGGLVSDIVVIGLQDPNDLSDTVVYFVVADNQTKQILNNYCKANLPGAWRPDKIVFLDELPKTRSGKPQLAKLKTLIG